MFAKVCPQCGKSFNAVASKIICCSTKCQYERRSTKEWRNCKHCNKPFQTQKKLKREFCSKTCRGAYVSNPKSKVIKPCLQCKKLFESWSYRNQKFCCRDCKHIYSFVWGAKNKKYGANWKSQKKKALKRDKNTCQICGIIKSIETKGLIDVHHIKPFRLFNGNYITANDLLNLITLCRKCHSQVERNKIECPKPTSYL